MDILSTLATHIASVILKQPKRVIQPGDKLISNGLVDSFSLVDLSIYIEDTFGVHLEDTELTAETFDTLQELADLIQGRQS